MTIPLSAITKRRIKACVAVVVVVENVTHGGYTAEVARDIFAEYFGMNASKIIESQEAVPSVQVIR